MKVVVYDDDHETVMFSMIVPPGGECVSPSLADQTSVLEALQDAVDFLNYDSRTSAENKDDNI